MKTKLLLAAMLLSAASYGQTIELQQFATGFNSPVEIVHSGGARLYVVEQGGLIKILNPDGTINETPFLDLSSLVSNGFEQGLLGLAFHPDYQENGQFYVNYTNLDGDTVIARFMVSPTDTAIANPSSQSILMTIDQPYGNHNGGTLRFGPDGYLYIGMGDGGSANDPENRAQNMETLLGKMLRIDVDNGEPYSIPEDNPFVGVAGADEIWASGLRNPWKFSFNRNNGDLWIADVGQEEIEEINKVATTAAGVNYGWRCYEGSAEFNTTGCSDAGMYTMPFAQYTHTATGGCSITGGYVYTGSMFPNMEGKYIFSDWCNNKIGVLDTDGSITYTESFAGNGFTAFGEDMAGELYVVGSDTGTIYRVTDSSLGTAQFRSEVLTLYPNPASDKVNIRTDREAIVRIFDIGGKQLLEQQLHEGENAIGTTSLQTGIYLVEVQSETTAQKQKLIIR